MNFKFYVYSLINIQKVLIWILRRGAFFVARYYPSETLSPAVLLQRAKRLGNKVKKTE